MENLKTEDSAVQDSVRISRILGQKLTDSRESEPQDLGELEPRESNQVNQLDSGESGESEPSESNLNQQNQT